MPQAPQNVALVTGAARGIGLATAKHFLAEGWRVALLDIEGELLARRGRRAGRAESHAGAALRRLRRSRGCSRDGDGRAARFGRLDALVNNAGIAVFAPLLETSRADWQRVLAVNLTGPFLCTKAAAPLMREQGGGAIVNITSISAVRASTLRSAYGTSKAGARAPDQAARGRARRRSASASTPSRRARSTPRWRRQVHTSGDPRRLSRRHPAQPLRPGGGTRRGDLLPVLGTRELHHRPNSGGRWRLRCRRHRPADAARRTAERIDTA